MKNVQTEAEPRPPIEVWVVTSEKPFTNTPPMKPEYGFYLGLMPTQEMAIAFARKHLGLGLGEVRVFKVTYGGATRVFEASGA